MDEVAAFAATVVSGVLAVVLLARGHAGGRAYLLAWGASLALFSVGSAALLAGAATSWTEGIFRVYYLAGGVLTVPLLGLGSVWLLAPGAGRAATIAVAAFCVAAIIAVLAADPRAPIPADEVPSGAEVWDPAPRAFAVAGNVSGTLVVVGGTLVSLARVLGRRRRGEVTPRDRRIFEANVLITVGVLVAASGGAFLFLGAAASKAVPLAGAAILIFAGYTRTAPLRT